MQALGSELQIFFSVIPHQYLHFLKKLFTSQNMKVYINIKPRLQ